MGYQHELWPWPLTYWPEYHIKGSSNHLPTKYEASGVKCSCQWVISCTRLRETDIPSFFKRGIINMPLFLTKLLDRLCCKWYTMIIIIIHYMKSMNSWESFPKHNWHSHPINFFIGISVQGVVYITVYANYFHDTSVIFSNSIITI